MNTASREGLPVPWQQQLPVHADPEAAGGLAGDDVGRKGTRTKLTSRNGRQSSAESIEKAQIFRGLRRAKRERLRRSLNLQRSIGNRVASSTRMSVRCSSYTGPISQLLRDELAPASFDSTRLI